jgi:hypothetical protein
MSAVDRLDLTDRPHHASRVPDAGGALRRAGGGAMTVGAVVARCDEQRFDDAHGFDAARQFDRVAEAVSQVPQFGST